MKILATVGLALALMFGSAAVAQDKKGYDLGSCSTDSFLAAHILVVGKNLEMDLVNPAPGKIVPKEKHLVYKFVSEDKDGKHYVTAVDDKDEKSAKLELVLAFDRKIGYFLANGEKFSVIFIQEDEDGSKLADKGLLMYKACTNLWDNASEDPSVSKS